MQSIILISRVETECMYMSRYVVEGTGKVARLVEDEDEMTHARLCFSGAQIVSPNYARCFSRIRTSRLGQVKCT